MRRGQRRSDLGDRINAQTRAAQYVRMSTEHQKYSIANQAAAIAEYAAARAISIVKTYEDAAKSGLRFEGRKGLQRLIADVKSGQTDFETVLVYDVSRWGRFQDVDESAYYEFICKNAGINVYYCAEPFDNDGSLTASVLKSIKRAMAGEYSRELSVKVFASQSRIAALGFKAGGPSGYGLRRQIVDQHGNRKGELRHGEHKACQSDRVILVPGPQHEIETVQKIYRLFLHDDLLENEIASRLNEEGVLTEQRRPWTSAKVHGVLTKEKYIGNQVYNRTSKKLDGKLVSNPPEMWIRRVGAFEPIVSIELFGAARTKIAARTCDLTDSELIDRLREVLRQQGALSTRLIKAAGNMPSSMVYRNRFGSLLRAWELAGYKPKYNCNYLPTRRQFRSIVDSTIEDIIRNIEHLGGTVKVDRELNLLEINDEFTTSIQAVYCNNYRSKTLRWRIRFAATPKADIVIALRMNESNTDVLDYYIMPRIDIRGRFLWLHQENRFEIDAYRCDTLAHLFALCSRQPILGEAQGLNLL
jgi:DNA invertase Pin-like site-specific DNA recombinase